MTSTSLSALPNNAGTGGSRNLPSNLVVVIAGPTGVGKSEIAAKLCTECQGMIVSADSVQVYRGVQIGANKPTKEERAEVPHLLVDMVDASDQYNAADWRRDALTSIELMLQKDITEKDNPNMNQIQAEISDARSLKGYDAESRIQPFIVGGTMMYIQWLVQGRPDASRPSPVAVRKAHEQIIYFQARESNNGWEEAIELVSSLNPVFQRRLETLCGRDWYRLRRILEIAYTALDSSDPVLLESLFNGEREGGLQTFGYDVRCFFVCPDDRMAHTAIIDQRCEDMILQGLLQETTDLVLSSALPDMATKAIGYRQALEYLQRSDYKPQDSDAWEAFLDDFSTSTRRYAKKQMQWFRKDNSFTFVPVSLQAAKENRVKAAAARISELCHMSRLDYERELLPKDAHDLASLSHQTRLSNLEQGKKMKFYQFQRYKLKKGCKEYENALKQADECSNQLRIFNELKSQSPVKRPRLL